LHNARDTALLDSRIARNDRIGVQIRGVAKQQAVGGSSKDL
jgi:hypothetical protein